MLQTPRRESQKNRLPLVPGAFRRGCTNNEHSLKGSNIHVFQVWMLLWTSVMRKPNSLVLFSMCFKAELLMAGLALEAIVPGGLRGPAEFV